MKKTIEQLHLSAQYLAAAAMSFLEKKSDDSHSNLGWNPVKSRMETHPFGSGKQQLTLNLASNHLEWLTDGVKTDAIDLRKNKHSEIMTWISEQASKNKIGKQYTYEFHYDLPYPFLENNDQLTFNPDTVNEMIHGLNIGQEGFEKFLTENNLNSPIRVWPHHFDLGIYTSLSSEKNLFMGAGLAIPDSLVDDFYYYASGYNDGSAIETKSFSGLSYGKWRSDWKGATLPSSQVDSKTITHFLNEARKGFLAMT